MDDGEQFQWTERMATGVPLIDRQHGELLTLFQGIAAFERKGEREQALAGLEELVGAICRHFDLEEHVMHRHHYPEAEAHAQAHGDLLKQIRSFATLMAADPRGRPGLDLIDFVGRWLVGHIQEEDRRLGDFLRAEAPDELEQA